MIAPSIGCRRLMQIDRLRWRISMSIPNSAAFIPIHDFSGFPSASTSECVPQEMLLHKIGPISRYIRIFDEFEEIAFRVAGEDRSYSRANLDWTFAERFHSVVL